MKDVRQAVSPASSAAGTPCGRSGTRRSPRPTSTRWRQRRPSGAVTAGTSAASRWPSAGSATRWTATACWWPPMTARTGSAASCRFVPWGRNGLSLDLMRRDPTADNGLVEFLVAGLAARAGDLGASRVSLNFAMFREAFERGESARRRARSPAPGGRVLMVGNSNWQLESPVPLERQVLPGLAAAVHLLRVRLRPAPGRHRRRQRRGVPHQALAGPGPAPRRAEEGAGALDRSSEVYAAEVAALIPAEEDPLAAALSTDGPARAGAGPPREARADPGDGDRPVPGRATRARHTLAEVRAQAGELAAGHPDRDAVVSVVGPGHAQARQRQAVLRHAARRVGRPAGDAVAWPRSARSARPLEARSSTSATTCRVTGEVITIRKGELSRLGRRRGC